LQWLSVIIFAVSLPRCFLAGLRNVPSVCERRKESAVRDAVTEATVITANNKKASRKALRSDLQ
jgi:hypothetical protein